VDSINLPLVYTYVTRVGDRRGLITHLAHGWIPLIVVLNIVYFSHVWLTLIMLIGLQSLYECGYLINDTADSAVEPGGNRLNDRRIDLAKFWSLRLLVFMVVAVVLLMERGIRFAVEFAVPSVLVFAVLWWHTTRRPRRFRYLRIWTFAILAIYKFSPAVLPQIPLADAQLLLLALFLCSGVERIVFYTLEKFGEAVDDVGGRADRELVKLADITLIIFAPLLISTHWSIAYRKASCILWLWYASIALLRRCMPRASTALGKKVRESTLPVRL